MNLRQIDDELPNGFHDALLEQVTISLVLDRVEIDLQLLVGDPDGATEAEREAYKKARLILSEVVYFVIEPPGPGSEYSNPKPLRIDAGEATDENPPRFPKPLRALPEGAFGYWFFVDSWNSFIHFAARNASLSWL